MKRWIAIIVALVLVLGLTACGGAATEPKEESKPSEPIQTDTGTPSLPNEPTEPTEPAEPAEPAEPERDYVLEHNVVVDDENCLFVITGMEEDYGEIVFNVYVENRTDLTLMFALDNVLINGYLNDPYWATEVAPGKKANSAFTFDKDTLQKYDLLPIDELRFTLRAYDSDDWSADDLLNDIFTVYPTGMNGEIVKRPDRIHVEGEQVLVDDSNGTFAILSPDPNGFWGYTLNAYVENKTNDTMMFAWDDVSVNGFMVNSSWASSVPAHAAGYVTISFFDSELEDNGIKDVEEIEFTLRMYDDEDWDVDGYVEDVFTYKP